MQTTGKPTDASMGPEASLPTLSKLGQPHIPQDLDAVKVASEWVASFAKSAEQADVDGLLDLIATSSFALNIFKGDEHVDPSSPQDILVYWRDVLALTWDIRTFEGTANIKQFLSKQLASAKISNVQLQTDVPPELQRLFPDLAWIQVLFKFETKAGLCSGVARLVPISNASNQELTWKAHSVFTNLDDLKGFPEKIGPLRNHQPNHGKWEAARTEEVGFEGKDPTVLIIGGGHSGLGTAARLKALDIPTLIIERNSRIGDNWRTRYEALCLHDPVWFDHLPYLPFPPSWPVFTPAKKLANWLEHYAESMELNIWTSSTVKSATQNPKTKSWSVTVTKADGSERVFNVKHVVLAIGFKGGVGYIPTIPGMESFKGEILHSSHHNKAADHAGKKIVVVGSCTSAHDICVDYANHGIDVTMFQRSSTYVMSTKNGVPILLGGLYSENGPPTALADKLNASMSNLLMAGVTYRASKMIADADKETLDGLHKRGFRTNGGFKDTGLLLSVFTRAGGYYMDVGGSQYIIDGKIKLKNDAQIQGFAEGGLKFDDGSELAADVVIFCTGYLDTRHSLRKLFGDEVADKSTQIWGLTEEGELSGCYRDFGYEGLYNIQGNLALCRFYSKTLALQIKAIEEGVFGERYSAYTGHVAT
ncbi:hypothetical protein GALMADRAFT_244116 [Galerina marginata CBS 339.88]|uniref:FAD/NAD(P)-binding domain-containing protein n=1 Tax=Galerina marginata (strain CBS 339.88) TaxID=685588 RepID=A0A067TFG1_GALM3|nr:hypothetical protein GALMADRAFT_244116 [Galerina marginata CBS 339.88]